MFKDITVRLGAPDVYHTAPLLTPDAIAVTIEPMGVRRQDFKITLVDLTAVLVRRRRLLR